MRRLPGLAVKLGVAEVLVKDESSRLGLPSYKILGASWATYRALETLPDVQIGPWSNVEDLAAALADVRPRRLVAATDGNHGRAVARMARLLGWPATILVPEGTADARVKSIVSEGAAVTVVDGTYDEAVVVAAAQAGDDVLVISDTAWPGYVDVPTWVIQGYSTIFAEVDEALGADPPPTHVVIPIGVGALAAAAADHYGSIEGTTLLGVEPADAACVLASVGAGRLVEVPGPHRSMMAGLNCGLPSPLAFARLQRNYAGFVAVSDDWAADAVRLFAAEGLAVGESGAAPLAGLLALTAAAGDAAAAGLSERSQVLLIATEGVTDPANYARLVG